MPLSGPSQRGAPRARRAASRARSVSAAGLALVLCTVLGAALARDGSTDARSAAAGAGVRPCESPPVRERCAAVDVTGDPVRYSLVRASPATTATVYVDLGGPGVAALSGRFHLGSFRSPLGGGSVNLLFVEEPWVRRAVPDACRTALTRFYGSLRAGVADDDRAHDVAVQCAIGATPRRWGHSPTQLRAAIAEIVRTERVTLRGVVALSFGAVRWAELATAPVATSVAWVVLVRPFPLGASGARLVAARAAAVTRQAGAVEPIAGEQPVAGRSVPVTRFDQLSAEIEMGYAYTVAAHRAIARGDTAVIGRLSDALWLRYGADSISPAYLAYLDEVCAAGVTWPAVSALESVADVLAAAHLPCRWIRSGPRQVTELPRRATCVVVSAADTVTPANLVTGLSAHRSDVSVVSVQSPAHGSSDGVPTCLRRLGAP